MSCSILNSKLLAIRQASLCLVRNNCNRASVTKIKRATYVRMYPTLLVLPDGSSITIRYHEPRKIIKLPLDLSTLSPEMQQLRLLKRKGTAKTSTADDIKDSFDARKYISLLNNKKKPKQ